MELTQSCEQSHITDQNQSLSAKDKMKPKKLVFNLANQKELESTSTQPAPVENVFHTNASINGQSAENEVASRIATEIVNQCVFGSPKMEANPNSSTKQFENCFPAMVKHRMSEDIIKIESKLQPQPQRRMTLPAAIHIMNEFGQKTDVIDIDPNNNCQQLAMSKIGNKRNNRNHRYRLTTKEKTAAVLIKNVSFGYTKNHNIISNISLQVPVGK